MSRKNYRGLFGGVLVASVLVAAASLSIFQLAASASAGLIEEKAAAGDTCNIKCPRCPYCGGICMWYYGHPQAHCCKSNHHLY